jgi:hypothetical protein
MADTWRRETAAEYERVSWPGAKLIPDRAESIQEMRSQARHVRDARLRL